MKIWLKNLSGTLAVLVAALASHATETRGPVVVERGPDHRIWERVTEQQLAPGKITQNKSRVVEIGTGMHRFVGGQWVECRNTIDIINGYGVARETRFPVIFAPSPNVAAAVDCEAPDGKRFRCNLLGVALYDVQSNNSLLIAEPQDAVGELHPPNRVYYAGALSGTSPEFGAVDVYYTVELAGWEQFVVIRNRFSLPANFDPETTRLECWTEFLDPPVPVKHIRTVNRMSDENLDFGAITVGPGKAFMIGTPGANDWSTPVAKAWVNTAGRVFLVESVPWSAIEKHIRQLPAPNVQAAVKRDGNRRPTEKRTTVVGRNGLRLPSQRAAATPKEPVRMASVAMPDTGFVIDASPVLSGVSITLEGDKTYLCSSTVLCTNLTIEGGAVVKYTNNASIELHSSGWLTCLTSPYRPAIFTSVFDGNVGEIISTNSSPGREASTALVFHNGNQTLKHVRVSYAQTGVTFDDGVPNIAHSVFTHCNLALNFVVGYPNVVNCLFYSVSNAFSGYNYQIQAAYITFDLVSGIGHTETDSSSLTLWDSIVARSDWGDTMFSPINTIEVSDAACFQTVGGASHYLANNSQYRNAGGTAPDLGFEIRSKTTYPPVVYPHLSLITNRDITLTPEVQRDTDTPDLGFHYEPMDFVFGAGFITNATVYIKPGTVVGFYNTEPNYGYGFGFGHGGRIISEGSPTNLARLVRYSTVQEIANTNWSGAVGPLIYTPWSEANPPPEFRFRFTDFSVLGRETHLVYGDFTFITNMPALSFADCQFRGGMVHTFAPSMLFTNCLFERVDTQVWTLDAWPFTNRFQNNLFYGGEVLAYPYASTNEITFRDNLFDKTVLSNSAQVANSHNGYVTNQNRLTPSGSTDVILTSLSYLSGPLARYYLPTTSPLINAGSVTNAALKGMYWHSSFTTGTWEGNSPLNIGLMFIAVTNGVPVDTDGEGLASYLEDANGNGTQDPGETSTSDTDSDDDGVSDYLEYRQGRNRLTNAVSDVNGVVNLKVFTPLK